jgi:hypothetical protein
MPFSQVFQRTIKACYRPTGESAHPSIPKTRQRLRAAAGFMPPAAASSGQLRSVPRCLRRSGTVHSSRGREACPASRQPARKVCESVVEAFHHPIGNRDRLASHVNKFETPNVLALTTTGRVRGQG